MDRTVLVTGCSSGIGRATAERFADAGWTVYATARDEDDVDALGRHGCRPATLDVTDPAAVDAVVDRVFAEAGNLDCLVNNAGYGQFGPVEDVPMEAVRRQFDVNTFGPLRLIHAALPRMRRRGRGTIINVGPGVGGLTVAGLGVYTASKYALASLTDALRQELAGTGVHVVLFEPGAVATEFHDRAADELAGFDHTYVYADLYRVLDDITVFEGGGPGVNSPERVADRILAAASTDRPRPVYRVGLPATVGTLLGGVVRGRARDVATRAGVRGLSSKPAQALLQR